MGQGPARRIDRGLPITLLSHSPIRTKKVDEHHPGPTSGRKMFVISFVLCTELIRGGYAAELYPNCADNNGM